MSAQTRAMTAPTVRQAIRISSSLRSWNAPWPTRPPCHRSSGCDRLRVAPRGPRRPPHRARGSAPAARRPPARRATVPRSSARHHLRPSPRVKPRRPRLASATPPQRPHRLPHRHHRGLPNRVDLGLPRRRLVRPPATHAAGWHSARRSPTTGSRPGSAPGRTPNLSTARADQTPSHHPHIQQKSRISVRMAVAQASRPGPRRKLMCFCGQRKGASGNCCRRRLLAGGAQLPFGLGVEAPAPEPAAVPPTATGSSPVTR